ncbi:hypothetical protein HDU92_000702 [Lobulomyces angularis]|nr:hypothetical protein HDU92_000702 [Lobulomyces angularis]
MKFNSVLPIALLSLKISAQSATDDTLTRDVSSTTTLSSSSSSLDSSQTSASLSSISNFPSVPLPIPLPTSFNITLPSTISIFDPNAQKPITTSSTPTATAAQASNGGKLVISGFVGSVFFVVAAYAILI